MERLYLNRFQSHVVSSPNFNSYQSAYRKFHCTETALLATLDYVYCSCNNSLATALVALDLSAAFDTVDHAILFNRLHASFRISGLVLQWLKSYLTERTQCVTLGRHTSSPTHLMSGVPQGSILGPILFTLYISPISSLITDFGIQHQQFADDTQLFVALSPSNFVDTISKIESCLLAVHAWFSQNWLALNTDKSDCILFVNLYAYRAHTITTVASCDPWVMGHMGHGSV
jgi:hypothetical protein